MPALSCIRSQKLIGEVNLTRGRVVIDSMRPARLLFASVTGACVIFLAYAFILYLPPSTFAVRSQGDASVSSTEPVQPYSSIGKPVTLKIPVLGVEARIQGVGKTAGGAMGSPQGINQFREAAWYKLGPRPGQEGSAVLAGHLDNAIALKGVFYDLDKLGVGDSIIVGAEDGTEVVFRVTGKQIYDHKNDTVDEVFTSADGKAHLNLVTCDGTWVQSERSYTERLVVFSDLVAIRAKPVGP